MALHMTAQTFGASALLAIGLALLPAGDTPNAHWRSFDTAQRSAPLQPVWHDTAWPFLNDAWGAGRAYECPASSCGVPVRVYVRAKIGFCDCARGVADDAELDRVGDIDLMSRDFTAAGDGYALAVGAMHGRARRYTIVTRAGAQPALSVAFAATCNVAVATVVSGATLSDEAADAAIAFVRGATVVRWAQAALGV